LIKNKQSTITQVFEKEKTAGKFNDESARKWLMDKLGLREEQIFVVNGILKGL